MAGLIFLVSIPSAAHEKELILQCKQQQQDASKPLTSTADLIHLGESPLGGRKGDADQPHVPMETVLEELLIKQQIENATWYKNKKGNLFQVVFPVSAGDQCENCLHFLTELGIGRRLNSLVSVIPCNVFKQGLSDDSPQTDGIEKATPDGKGSKSWLKFVDSVRSKLTVAQVVDGVRSSGELTFDFVLLVVTAGMVAAMGLVENSSVNIVAAMLISPLMGPIVTATFGVVIADRKLQLIGIRTELTGLGLCLLFGFIFGLIIGSAENPWGSGDWPTSEMKGRGNYRSLWTGILVALPSGTGVALALLAGSAGPLIGVAISASLLPPVINCGMMWGLACNVLMYPDTVKIPFIEGESLTNWTSTYEPLYSDYIPTELAILGCISFCLTLVNIACIFMAAIIVLKIKEVAAPFTSSPEMRRFWEKDIKVTREYNKSIMSSEDAFPRMRSSSRLQSLPPDFLERQLEEAVRQAVQDETFKKVRRVSYYQQSTPEVTEQLGIGERAPKDRQVTRSGDLRMSLLEQRAAAKGPPRSPTDRLSRSLRLGSRKGIGRAMGCRLSLLHPRGSERGGLPTIEEGSKSREIAGKEEK